MKFVEGQTLKARFINNSDTALKGTVTKRTAKTLWVNVDVEGIKRCKIHSYEGIEYVLPLGAYSMAPRFKAA